MIDDNGHSLERWPRLACVAAMLLAVGGVQTASAQDTAATDARSGRWISFGIGAGHAAIDCSRCGDLSRDDPWDGGVGFSGFAAIGGTPRPDLQLGGEVNLWGKVQRRDGEQRDATLMLIALVARYFPLPGSGVSLSGAVGYGGSILAGGPGLIESGGVGLRAGAGYDVMVARRLALAPFASYVQIFSEGAAGRNRGDPVVGPDHPSYLQIGVRATWY